MGPLPDSGLVHLSSYHSVPETLERLESILGAHGLTVFARVDHGAEADKVGLKMQPTQFLVFGSPKTGIPLMVAAPTLAIDLPLKTLVWEDAEGHGEGRRRRRAPAKGPGIVLVILRDAARAG
jgi:uncharacterized protein (DUF302 family)